MRDKYRDKVRKLLALAESSNPHEAERARIQAKKLMAKYNINAEDTEIIEVVSTSVPRRHLKDFESHLVGCINSVSGCESYLISRHFDDKRIRSSICFVGVAQDANMAAYCMDVLHNQLKRYQWDLKTKKGLNPEQRNVASLAWVVSACEKLTSFFDYKIVPDHVKNYYENEMKGVSKDKSHSTKNLDDDRNRDLLYDGYSEGAKALLNKATEHKSFHALEEH